MVKTLDAASLHIRMRALERLAQRIKQSGVPLRDMLDSFNLLQRAADFPKFRLEVMGFRFQDSDLGDCTDSIRHEDGPYENYIDALQVIRGNNG